jgi:hypothetical protein
MESSPVLAAINAELRRLESVAGLYGQNLGDEELERLGPLIVDARLALDRLAEALESGHARGSTGRD